MIEYRYLKVISAYIPIWILNCRQTCLSKKKDILISTRGSAICESIRSSFTSILLNCMFLIELKENINTRKQKENQLCNWRKFSPFVSMAGSGKKSVLFVCLGNICRSPIAEAVFRHLVSACISHVSNLFSYWHDGLSVDFSVSPLRLKKPSVVCRLRNADWMNNG